MKKFGQVTILVKDYDEALKFYTQRLGFIKKSDQIFGENMRWLTVAPSVNAELEIVFVKADTPQKKERVGNQAGEHVLLTLETNDCRKDYELLKSKGVYFFGEPTDQFYGTEVVFQDLYGNRIDLIQVAVVPHRE